MAQLVELRPVGKSNCAAWMVTCDDSQPQNGLPTGVRAALSRYHDRGLGWELVTVTRDLVDLRYDVDVKEPRQPRPNYAAQET